MPVDVSMYPMGQVQNDPLEKVQKLIELKNNAQNLNKLRGGMPNTVEALNILGANQPYGVRSGE